MYYGFSTGLFGKHRSTLLGLLLAYCAALGMNYFGLANINYAWRTDKGLYSSFLTRFSIGSRTLYAKSGQTFYVDYDAQIQNGCLTFRVNKSNLFGHRDIKVKTSHGEVCQSGKGRWKYRIPETGTYRLRYHGSDKKADMKFEEDLTYTLRWGIE